MKDNLSYNNRMVMIRQANKKDYQDILRLNDADVEMLSYMDEDILDNMSKITEIFQVVEIENKIIGFIMAYREKSDYWGENYAWFNERYDTFLYIDRIVIDKDYRQLHLGRQLYENIFAYAKKHHIPYIAAEIDVAPQYNEASMAFHKKMGFHEVGRKLFKDTITVSLQIK